MFLIYYNLLHSKKINYLTERKRQKKKGQSIINYCNRFFLKE